MRECWLWLANLNINPHAKKRLLAHFGSVDKVYDARASEYREVVGLTAKDIEVLANKSMRDVKKILAACERVGAQIIPFDSQQYPNLLREISMPPYVLYVRGKFPNLDEELGISIVGTRKADKSGLNIAHRFAEELTDAGAYVISGMAEGIDGAANSGALSAGGATLAVLGCGVDIVYPLCHDRLMREIIDNGAVVSEYPPGTRPLGFNFPARNRILSGLARGVLAIQVPVKSGARITVDFAMQQNRDVFVAPGNIDSKLYVTSNRLIQDGAKMVLATNDILEEYQSQFPNIRLCTPKSGEPTKQNLTSEEKQIVEVVGLRDLSVDEIIRETGMDAQTVLATLTMLELQGVLEQEAGKRFRLK